MIGESDLPAGLHRKIAYPHPERRAPRTRRNALVRSEVLVASAGAAGELDDETLAHEVGAICLSVSRVSTRNRLQRFATYGKLCILLARTRSQD
jgi:hypothetical protein